MSALGQKRTFAPQKVMSALPPKADMVFVIAKSKIKVENFWALVWARSLNRFFNPRIS
jgi:hypothetical protein